VEAPRRYQGWADHLSGNGGVYPPDDFPQVSSPLFFFRYPREAQAALHNTLPFMFVRTRSWLGIILPWGFQCVLISVTHAPAAVVSLNCLPHLNW
jgi:hypothetical protein